MAQMEIDFSLGEKVPGYRVKRFELYNWGTFHNGVYKILPNGESYYLTGGNGCGKSTLLDGFTTLLADVTKLTYNEAADSRSGERDLRSYVEGKVKPPSEDPDDESIGVPKYLRPWSDKKWYTVLLAQFHNQILDSDITLAVVLWLTAPAGQPNRFYVYSEKALSIAEDFSNFGNNIKELRKKLTNNSCMLFDTYSKYRLRFSTAFGISPKNIDQALGLFVRTVSMKKVEKLSKFIRDSVLKEVPFEDAAGNPLTWEDITSNVAEHYRVLYDNFARVKDAKQQIEMLKELPELDAQYKAVSDDINKGNLLADAITKWFGKNYTELAKAEIARIQQDNAAAEDKKSKKKKERADVISKGERLKSIYNNTAGGAQIELIEEKIRYTHEELDRKLRNYKELNKFTRSLSLPVCDSEEVFAENKNAIREMYNKNREHIAQLEDEKAIKKVDAVKYARDLKELENEIIAVEKQKSNIDPGLVNLRNVLCLKMGIPSTELPYAGELMEVKPEEALWEHAIESVLSGLAKTMLVPEKYYEQVKRWLDNDEIHKLSNAFRVNRLDFNLVVNGIKLAPQRNTQNTIADKLVYEAESPMYCWLRNTLNEQRYAYVCCDNSDTDDFKRAEKAITINGLRKEGKGRHIVVFKKETLKKLLGRNNAARLNELRCKYDELYQKAGAVNTEIRNTEQVINSLNAQNNSINDIEIRYSTFDDVNYVVVSNQLNELENGLKVLKDKSSAALQELQKQIAENKNELESLDDEIDNLVSEISANNTRIKNYEVEMAKVRVPEASPELDILFSEIDSRWESKLSYPKSVERLAEGRRQIVSDINSEKKNAENKLDELMKQIEDIERKYSEAYKAEADAAECVPKVEYLDKYLQRHSNLVENDLPECLEDLRQRKDELSQWDLMSFAGRQNMACKDVENTIRIINSSLTKLPFSVVDGVEHYIELKAIKATNNLKIREFQELLNKCNADSTIDGGMWSNEKYEAISEIIRRFTNHDKDTFEAIDVRNHYEFEAHEKRRDTGEKVDWYKDSDGRSGGEKEKLAYTVLAACLSYQFGMNDSNSKNQAMRFVLIDEAFRNHTDDSAEFALDLFREIGMQLILVTPGCSKSYLIEDYIGGVGYLVKDGESHTNIRNMSVETYHEERMAGKLVEPDENVA